jgi:hypothetical protein
VFNIGLAVQQQGDNFVPTLLGKQSEC